MFHEERYALNMFVQPQGNTECVLTSNTDSKHDMWLFTRQLHRAPSSKFTSTVLKCFN